MTSAEARLSTQGRIRGTSQLTGAEIVSLVRLITLLEDDTLPTVVNKYNLPVLSGAELRVSETAAGKIEFLGLRVNGEPIDMSATYTVTYAENSSIGMSCMGIALGDERAQAFFSDAEGKAVMARDRWVKHLTAGGKLEEPSDYLETE